MHWYEDGYIFRPAWADEFPFFFRITPGRGKVLAGVFLIALVLAIVEFSIHFYR